MINSGINFEIDFFLLSNTRQAFIITKTNIVNKFSNIM